MLLPLLLVIAIITFVTFFLLILLSKHAGLGARERMATNLHPSLGRSRYPRWEYMGGIYRGYMKGRDTKGYVGVYRDIQGIYSSI